MIRNINGDLYYDWPWLQNDIVNRKDYSFLISFKYLLNRVSDFKDSVFFVGKNNKNSNNCIYYYYLLLLIFL